MEQYVNKSDIVAEIKRIMDTENENINSFEQHRNTSEKQRYNARMALLEYILSFLNTLEVKEVDLEKELDRYTNSAEYVYNETRDSYFLVAKHFFELGLKAQKGE